MESKILILCTGNSCRSQMAEGFLKASGPELEVYSAGTYPEKEVNPFSIAVMKESGIDISSHFPKNVNEFKDKSFDYIITVCDNAKESCPAYSGEVKHRLHIGFADPAESTGSSEEKLNVYRAVRDEIKIAFENFYITKYKNQDLKIDT